MINKDGEDEEIIDFSVFETDHGCHFFIKDEKHTLSPEKIAIVVLYMLTDYCATNKMDFNSLCNHYLSNKRSILKEEVQA